LGVNKKPRDVLDYRTHCGRAYSVRPNSGRRRLRWDDRHWAAPSVRAAPIRSGSATRTAASVRQKTTRWARSSTPRRSKTKPAARST